MLGISLWKGLCTRRLEAVMIFRRPSIFNLFGEEKDGWGRELGELGWELGLFEWDENLLRESNTKISWGA